MFGEGGSVLRTFGLRALGLKLQGLGLSGLSGLWALWALGWGLGFLVQGSGFRV